MRDYLEILRHNCGFDSPEAWVEVARRLGFQKVDAILLESCPDCGDAHSTVIGQYVYYSQLVRLRRCAGCDLVYADVRLDPNVLLKHFEMAYKDEDYFLYRRHVSFERVTDIVVANASRGARVLDVGGAKGHLGRMLSDAGFTVTVNDVSADACRYAEERFGLRTIQSGIEALKNSDERFDVVIGVDVIYYVQHIKEAWDAISHVLAENGMLVLRLPNMLWRVRLFQSVRRLAGRDTLQTRLWAFNPEHMYYFTNRYLRSRLDDLGFQRVSIHCSPLNRDRGSKGLVQRAVYGVSQLIHVTSMGSVTSTPSKLLVAQRSAG